MVSRGFKSYGPGKIEKAQGEGDGVDSPATE